MRYSDLSVRYNTETGEPYVFIEGKNYAGFFVRLAAYLVDMLIVGAVLLPLKMLLALVPFASTHVFFAVSASSIFLYLLKALYFVLFLKLRGATPGKLLFKIEVVKKEGSITWLDAVYRETVGRYLSSILFVGYIMIGINSHKRGLHDYLCDTEVIYTM